MDEIKWQSIHRNRQAIVADLDVNDIASELYSNSVLTKSEYSQIQQKVMSNKFLRLCIKLTFLCSRRNEKNAVNGF